MWKQFVSQYLNFTRKERRGIITLLVLIIIFMLLPFLYPLVIKHKALSTESFKKEIAALNIEQNDSAQPYAQKNDDDDNYPNYYQPSDNNYRNKNFKGRLFYFDPNTASPADWQKLGLRDKTITTIQNYLAKGGHFYKPEDMGKIWGLHANEVQRLLPYVQIVPKENSWPKNTYQAKAYEKPEKAPVFIDINTADTSAFIALPGIGSKLAQRIISFRDKLGGFYTTGQVAETYGLPDSTFQKIQSRLSVSTAAIKKININTATADEMKTHPYIRYSLANAIVQYRSQHGNFTAVEDIKKIMLVTDDIFVKAVPYLTIE